MRRGFIFVHGIKGNFNDPGFDALLERLRRRYGPRLVRSFEYHQDAGHKVGTACPRERDLNEILPFNGGVDYPVDLPIIGESKRCDSNDDVGVNGLFLEHDVRELRHELGVDKITLISNSMGAAIVRAYLAYAMATRTDPARSQPGSEDTLRYVDAVVFLQGVQQGAFGAGAREFFDERPLLQPIRESLATTVRDLSGIDPERPAIVDLAPASAMIRYVNQLEHVPPDLHYLNVRSDIRLRPALLLLGYRYPFEVGVGDYLILPGDQDPTRTPGGGGAGFLPSTVALGRSSGQWTLRSDQVVFFEVAPVQVPLLIATQPESHFAFGGKMTELCVQTLVGRKRLDQALFDAIVALDSPRPNLDLWNFGSLGSLPCN